MPLFTFDKVLKIIMTILNVLSAALRAFNLDFDDSDKDELDNTAGSA